MAATEKRGIYYGWWVLAALFAVGAIGPQARYALSAFFPFITAETGWSRSEIGLAQSISLWCYALLSIPAGLMVDRLGGRKTILLGGILCLVGWSLMATIHSLWQLYLYYGFVMATIVSLTHLVSTQATSRKWFIRRAGLAAGIMGSAFAIGNALVTPLLTTSASAFGWRAVSLACALVFSVPIILLAYFVIRDTPESLGLRPDGLASEPAKGDSGETRSTPPIEGQFELKDALRTPHFWLLFLAYSFAGVVINGLLAHMVVWVTDLGATAAAAGLFVTLYNGPSVLSRVGGGWLGDRYGKSRILVLGALSAFLAMLLTWWLAGGVGNLIFLVLFMGLAVNPAVGLYAPYLGDLYGRRNVGALFAILTAGWGLIGGLGPMIWGLIYDRFHSYDLALLMSVICFSLALVALVVMRYLPRPAAAKMKD